MVADEVQSLANKSAVSAKNITMLIEESMRLVEQGTALSVDTTEALTAGVAGARSRRVHRTRSGMIRIGGRVVHLL